MRQLNIVFLTGILDLLKEHVLCQFLTPCYLENLVFLTFKTHAQALYGRGFKQSGFSEDACVWDAESTPLDE